MPLPLTLLHLYLSPSPLPLPPPPLPLPLPLLLHHDRTLPNMNERLRRHKVGITLCIFLRTPFAALRLHPGTEALPFPKRVQLQMSLRASEKESVEDKPIPRTAVGLI